jgi:GNAT superfamily N-acetyltransferase
MIPAPDCAAPLALRLAREEDAGRIIALTSVVYRDAPTWTRAQLASHRDVFPEGQFVVVRKETGDLVGMAASLIVRWDDYDLDTAWRDFTEGGTFRNHDPAAGHTLYGAEIMVHPAMQGQGVGSMLYRARESLARQRGLWRIRAGARLRDYHMHASRMTAADYAAAVVRGEMVDRTLTFQLRRGFSVLGVVPNYLRHDPESLGYAAVIEWKNPDAARDASGAVPASGEP